MKIVSSGDPVPDRPSGTVLSGILGGSAGPPAIGGGRVVFYSSESDGNVSLWSANTGGSNLARLADRFTPVPDSTGTFYDHHPYELAGGRVIFRGRASAPDHSGHYSVPATGGTVIRLADENTLIPGTTNRLGTLPIDSGEFHADGTNYVFAPGNLGASLLFVNVTTTSGQMRRLADPGMLLVVSNDFPMSTYSRPDISGGNVVAVVDDNPAALFLLPLSGLLTNTSGLVLNATLVASANTPVPGGPTNFHGGTFNSPKIDGQTVVFRAGWTTDGTNFTFGLYSWSHDAVRKLVDTGTAVPDGTGQFSGLASLENFALGGGHVVFVGRDASGREGIYHVPAAGGTIRKVLAVGDHFPFGTVAGNPLTFFQPPMQGSSLEGDALVLRLDFAPPAGRFALSGIFLVNLAQLTAPALRIRVEGRDVVLHTDTSDAGVRYQLERRPFLPGGDWQNLDDPWNGTDGPLEWRDTRRLAEDAQFYRLNVLF